MSRVESETERMTHLVEDMLLLARLDAGRPLGREPVTVVGDEARLQQVLANLLANARVHTHAGTSVTTSLAQEGDVAVLTVADDGPGIPADLLPEIFERFARGDPSRSRRGAFPAANPSPDGSTGLGPSIVAAVVRHTTGRSTSEVSPVVRGPAPGRFTVDPQPEPMMRLAGYPIIAA